MNWNAFYGADAFLTLDAFYEVQSFSGCRCTGFRASHSSLRFWKVVHVDHGAFVVLVKSCFTYRAITLESKFTMSKMEPNCCKMASKVPVLLFVTANKWQMPYKLVTQHMRSSYVHYSWSLRREVMTLLNFVSSSLYAIALYIRKYKW